MLTQFQRAFSFVMHFHILALLWPCTYVVATEFPALFTNATGDISQSFTLTQNGPLPDTTILENSTTETRGDVLVHCAKHPSWTAPSFHSDDCLGAIDFLFFETSVTDCYSQTCEFYGINTKTRIRKKNAQPTPRKYAFGKVIRNGFAMTLLSFQTHNLISNRCDIVESANSS